MSGVIRKKNTGDAWETVLDTGGGGSQPVLTQQTSPAQGENADFAVQAIAPIASGTYKLSFAGVTTAQINGTTGTMTDIANAMNAAYGATIARPQPGEETSTPNDDSDTGVQFVGALGAQVAVLPVVIDDTTDGGVAIAAGDFAGSSPNPVGTDGQILIDTSVPAAYQWGPAADATGSAVAIVWHRLWPVLVSDDGNYRVSIGSGSAGSNSMSASGDSATNTLAAAAAGGAGDSLNHLEASATGAGADATNRLSAFSTFGLGANHLTVLGDTSFNLVETNRADNEVVELKSAVAQVSLYVSAGDPTGVITPAETGAVCFSTAGALYIATGATAADWKVVSHA